MNSDAGCECKKNKKEEYTKNVTIRDPQGLGLKNPKSGILWDAYNSIDLKSYAGLFPYSAFPVSSGVATLKRSHTTIQTNDKGAAYFSLNVGTMIYSDTMDSLNGTLESQFAPYRWGTSTLPSGVAFQSNFKNSTYDGSEALSNNASVNLGGVAPFLPTDDTSYSHFAIKDFGYKTKLANGYYYSYLTKVVIKEISSLTERQGKIDVGISISFASDTAGSPHNYNKLKPDLVYSNLNALKDLEGSRNFEFGNTIHCNLIPFDSDCLNVKAANNVDLGACQRLHVIFTGCPPNTAIATIDVYQPFSIIPNPNITDLGFTGGLTPVSPSDYTSFMYYLIQNELMIRSEGSNLWGIK